MPRNPDGSYTLPYDDVVTNTTILSDWANTTLNDVEVALDETLDTQGRNRMGATLTLQQGSTGDLALDFADTTNTGVYYNSGDNYYYFRSDNTDVARFGSAGMQYWDGVQWVDPLTTSQVTGFVTTGTTQTITGDKTFTGDVKSSKGFSSATGNNLVQEIVDGPTTFTSVGEPTTISALQTTTKDSALVIDPTGAARIVTERNTDTTLAAFKQEIMDSIYPVGSVKYTVDDSNPGAFLPGTWERVAQGRFITSVGAYTDPNGFAADLPAGGESVGTFFNTLEDVNIPDHEHFYKRADEGSLAPGSVDFTVSGTTAGDPANTNQRTGFNTRGGDPSLEPQPDVVPVRTYPPFYSLYVWERTF